MTKELKMPAFCYHQKDTVSSAFWSLSGSLAGMTLHESAFCLC